MRGPDGVYGFVGDGVRSDYQPVNNSGLALGSPTDLNLPANNPSGTISGQQNGRQFQACSHYVQSGGLGSVLHRQRQRRARRLAVPDREEQLQERRDAGGPQLRPERPRPVRLPAINVKVGGVGLYK
jgi:levansucrase